MGKGKTSCKCPANIQNFNWDHAMGPLCSGYRNSHGAYISYAALQELNTREERFISSNYEIKE